LEERENVDGGGVIKISANRNRNAAWARIGRFSQQFTPKIKPATRLRRTKTYDALVLSMRNSDKNVDFVERGVDIGRQDSQKTSVEPTRMSQQREKNDKGES
jgi:hypothetical protein